MYQFTFKFEALEFFCLGSCEEKGIIVMLNNPSLVHAKSGWLGVTHQKIYTLLCTEDPRKPIETIAYGKALGLKIGTLPSKKIR